MMCKKKIYNSNSYRLQMSLYTRVVATSSFDDTDLF